MSDNEGMSSGNNNNNSTEDEGMGPRGAGAAPGTGKKGRMTEAQRLKITAGADPTGKRAADKAAKKAAAEAAAANKEYAQTNIGKLSKSLEKVKVPKKNWTRRSAGGAAAAAPAPVRPSELLPLVLRAKAEHESAIRELEEITKNNSRENNGTLIAQSAVGLSKRAAAEQNLIDKKAAFDEVYNEYLAEGGKPLAGGLRRRRAKKTKRRRAHTKRRQTKRR